MTFTPIYFPLYRVRVTSAAPGYRLIDFGRRMYSAAKEADRINATGGDLMAIVESYDRHTGETIRDLSAVWAAKAA